MLHTIYTAKFKQTTIHQHVHLRRESQSHAQAHVLMRLYPIDKSTNFMQVVKINKGIFSKLVHTMCTFNFLGVVDNNPTLISN